MAVLAKVEGSVGAQIVHVVKGETLTGADLRYGSGATAFYTPKLDLGALVWKRTEPGPAFDVKLSEILDLLVATGEALRKDENGFMAEAAEQALFNSPYDAGIIARSYQRLPEMFSFDRMMSFVEGEIGDVRLLDGWVPFKNRIGGKGSIRAFPPRLVHVLAGNAPGVAANSIIRGAITKGVNLLKLP